VIPFAKVHACGNDFLIVEMQHVSELPLAELSRRLCARNTGVGADGVEYLSWTGESSGCIHLHNSDGSIAEISGNGTRCVAAYMARRKRTKAGGMLTIETDAGVRRCSILRVDENRFMISSAMGVPSLNADEIVLEDGQKAAGVVVSTGNPHFVIFVEGRDFRVLGRAWQEIGSEICHHPNFPQQTNVEFVRVVGSDEIEIRIFERGAGPTSSSGTGTCATAAATMRLRSGARHLNVIAPGGAQQVDWPADDAEIRLTGPSEIVYFGEAF